MKLVRIFKVVTLYPKTTTVLLIIRFCDFVQRTFPTKSGEKSKIKDNIFIAINNFFLHKNISIKKHKNPVFYADYYCI